MVLANPEIAELPNWVIALVAAGALAAALSTAAGLLLVISFIVFCKIGILLVPPTRITQLIFLCDSKIFFNVILLLSYFIK